MTTIGTTTLATPQVVPQVLPRRRTGRRASTSRRRPLHAVLSVLGWLAVVVLLAQWPVRWWVAEPLAVTTASMTPTLMHGDRVLTVKAGVGHHTWQRGDVVSFRHDHQVWVKRVVAVGGQVVGLRDGELVVDGRHIHEPWSEPFLIDGVFFGPVRVPVGSVFVMGDDRGNSVDSRSFGAVPISSVTGRVVGVVWPPSAWSTDLLGPRPGR